jgi:hypothetical protein
MRAMRVGIQDEPSRLFRQANPENRPPKTGLSGGRFLHGASRLRVGDRKIPTLYVWYFYIHEGYTNHAG